MPDLRRRLQETIGQKYRVVRELTGGGMSRVFLSEDTALEREVVVKVLSPDLVDAPRVERFRQEVLQTARLQHPTIVPLLEVGAIDDGAGRRVPYYIMPYVRGESLRSRLRHEGRLSTGLAIRILRGVLDALAHAHAHGVVHRDIKPENIFLSGTSAVLADFGIAKAIAGPGSNDSKTADGVAVGTPSYMAPEQLVGQGQIDHRADLYAVGVVAYEILTGELPFGGSTRTLAEKLALQARGELASIRGVRPDVPAEIATVIESCLSWNVKGRPESAQQVLRLLESIPITPTTDTYKVPGWLPIPRMGRRGKGATVGVLAVGALVVVGALFNPLGDGDAGRTPRKLAVLYPELGPGGGERTLNEQLFRTLVATMNPISGLRLVGQVTVPQMVKQGFTSQQIGDSLRAQGADSALVFRARPRTDGGYMLSLELQQLGAGGNNELLAGPLLLGSLDGLSPDSVRAIVGMLAGQVVAKLRLSSASRTVPESQIIDAWLAWSRGREAYARRSPEGLATAIQYFERAIALDSMYAQAHAELAQTLALSLFYKYRRAEPPYEVAARALRLADRAILLQPNFADGYLARGYLGSVAGAPADFVEKNYTDVQRLPSTNPYSQVWLVGLLAAKGQFEEALAKLEQEVRLDPRSPAQRIATALYALPAKRYLVTVRDAAAAQAMGSNIPLASQLELIGRLQLGGRAVDECVNVRAGPYLGLRSLCLERVGRHAESRAAVDALFAMITDKAPVDSTFDLSVYVTEMSTYYAARRERDSARQWLRQGMLESPAAIDVRLIRSGFFDDELITFGDSLRHEAWKRVVQMAERSDREGRAVR